MNRSIVWCQQIVKNAFYDFTEPMTMSNVRLCVTNNPKPKIQFTITKKLENKKMFTFQKQMISF